MKKTTAVSAGALAVLAFAGSVRAHHNGSMFDPSPIWVSGTVTSYEPVNPHAKLVLEERTENGDVRQWTVEGPRLGRIASMGEEPEVGDTIEVCGFGLRASVLTRNGLPDPYGLSGRFVHGQALKMPDGHLEMFGSYGKLDHCLRPEDGVELWLEFLDTYRFATAAWCGGQRFSIPSIAPKAMLDEINRRMAAPCD
jgi:hypothetical protein